MFGVRMTEPWNPTSLQPRSSITISTMWGGFEAVVLDKDTDRKKTANAMRNIPWARKFLFKYPGYRKVTSMSCDSFLSKVWHVWQIKNLSVHKFLQSKNTYFSHSNFSSNFWKKKPNGSILFVVSYRQYALQLMKLHLAKKLRCVTSQNCRCFSSLSQFY